MGLVTAEFVLYIQTSECVLQVECSDMFTGDMFYSLVRQSSAERLKRLFECELVSVAVV